MFLHKGTCALCTLHVNAGISLEETFNPVLWQRQMRQALTVWRNSAVGHALVTCIERDMHADMQPQLGRVVLTAVGLFVGTASEYSISG